MIDWLLALPPFLFGLDLHIVDNLVRLVHVPIVKAAEDVFTWSIDCSSEQEVWEEQLVALVVQFVVTVRGHGPVPLRGHLLQSVSFKTRKVLIEVAQRLSSDIVDTHLTADHIEDHPRDQLNPNGEVINASTALAHPRPHVKPRGQWHRVHNHLAVNKKYFFAIDKNIARIGRLSSIALWVSYHSCCCHDLSFSIFFTKFQQCHKVTKCVIVIVFSFLLQLIKVVWWEWFKEAMCFVSCISSNAGSHQFLNSGQVSFVWHWIKDAVKRHNSIFGLAGGGMKRVE